MTSAALSNDATGHRAPLWQTWCTRRNERGMPRARRTSSSTVQVHTGCPDGSTTSLPRAVSLRGNRLLVSHDRPNLIRHRISVEARTSRVMLRLRREKKRVAFFSLNLERRYHLLRDSLTFDRYYSFEKGASVRLGSKSFKLSEHGTNRRSRTNT